MKIKNVKAHKHVFIFLKGVTLLFLLTTYAYVYANYKNKIHSKSPQQTAQSKICDNAIIPRMVKNDVTLAPLPWLHRPHPQ